MCERLIRIIAGNPVRHPPARARGRSEKDQRPKETLPRKTRNLRTTKSPETRMLHQDRLSGYLVRRAALLTLGGHPSVIDVVHRPRLTLQPNLLFLFLSLPAVNMGLLTLAYLYGKSELRNTVDQPSRAGAKRGTWAIGLASASQMLLIVVEAAWQIRWLRFPPGNVVVVSVIFVGLLLSASSGVAAFLTRGLRRWVSVLVALTTAAQWLLAAAGVAAG